MNNEKLIVVLPAYNEENDVRLLVETWLKYKTEIKENYHLNLEITVINDGSSDRTKEICMNLEKMYPEFHLINHSTNKGLGEAVKTGFLYASKEKDCQYVCLMDCDNTQHPKYILSMLKKADADVVVASRYQKGAVVKGVAKYRLMTSEGARFIYGFLLHVKNVKDYTCGYRLYKNEILQKAFETYDNNFVSESGFTCMAEILYKLSLLGAKFKEIPFELRYDCKGGSSKMKVVKTAINSISLAFRLRKLKKI